MQLIEALLGSMALAGTSLAANHMVKVGAGGDIVFDPVVTTAAMGDTVTFEFLDEHNVIQGEEDSPCVPMKGGFYSTTLEPDDGEMFQITINSTDPIYFYCSYDSHCIGGMVGVINGPMSDYEAYEKASLMVDSSDVGTPMPIDQAVGGELIKASSMGGGSSSGGDDDDDDDDDDGDMPSGSGGSSSNSGSNDMDNDMDDDMDDAASLNGAPLALAGLAAAAIALFTI